MNLEKAGVTMAYETTFRDILRQRNLELEKERKEKERKEKERKEKLSEAQTRPQAALSDRKSVNKPQPAQKPAMPQTGPQAALSDRKSVNKPQPAQKPAVPQTDGKSLDARIANLQAAIDDVSRGKKAMPKAMRDELQQSNEIIEKKYIRRIEKMQTEEARLKQRLARAETQLKKTERSEDAHAKIVLGGILVAAYRKAIPGAEEIKAADISQTEADWIIRIGLEEMLKRRR